MKWRRRPASQLVPTERFVDDSPIFSTVGGGYGQSFGVTPMDPDWRTRDRLSTVSDRLKGAAHLLPEGSLLYRYAIRKRGHELPGTRTPRLDFLERTAELGETQFVWTLYWPPPESWIPGRQASREWSRTALAELHRAGVMLSRQLSDVLPLTPLTPDETGAFYSYLLTLEPKLVRMRLRSRNKVNQQLPKVDLVWDEASDYLKIGHRYVQAFSMLDPPAKTRPAMLSDLLTLDADLVLCSIWRPKTPKQTRLRVAMQEGYIGVFKYAVASVLTQGDNREPPPRTAKVRAAEKNTDNLAAVLSEVDEGTRYGQFAQYGLVHSREPRDLQAILPHIHKAFQEPYEAELLEETVGAMSAYQAMFPGNQRYALATHWLSDRHHANLAPIYAPVTGSVKSEALGEYTGIYQTRRRTAYYFDPFWKDLRGLLIVGPPRTGKSMNGNYLVHAEQKFGGYTYVFDIGRNYQQNILSHGGSILDIGLDQSLGNLFALPETDENVLFLFGMIRMLLRKSGMVLAPKHESVLAAKIRQHYRLDPEVRRLKYLVNLLPNELRPGLAKWIEGGIYGRVFDNTDPLPCFERLQGFEFQAVNNETGRDLIEPSLYWLSYLIREVVEDPANLGVPKHLLFEELWKEIESPGVWTLLFDELKTGGKRLAGVTLLTHTPEDMGARAGIIKNSCPLTMFLPHEEFPPELRAKYGAFFGLNTRELDNIASLKSGELMLKTPAYSVVLVANFDEDFYWRCTTRPKEIMLRNQALAEHGARAFEVLQLEATA